MAPQNKIVLLPIEVPNGDCCWDGHYEICEHYDNEGGHSHCDLNLGDIRYATITGNVPKPKECLELKDGKKKNA